MKNVLFQAICRMGIFMICAQAILHFRPNESYEKYLKLLVSIMVLIQLFLPVGSLFLGGGNQDAAKLLEQFKRELAVSMQEAEKNAKAADELLQQMTLEEVRRRAQEQASAQEDAAGPAGGGFDSEAGGEIRIELEGIEPIKIEREE